MAEFALGWLGWSEEQALSADVNAIQVGMRGRVAMLKAVFGGSEDAPTAPAAKPEPVRVMTPGLFKAMFTGRS